MPGSTSLLPRKCPAPPLLPLACGSLENRCSSRYLCGIAKICYDCFYPKKIHYRGQDPHIHGLSNDLLQLMTVFSSHWNFVNSEKFWHTWWNLWVERSGKAWHTCICLPARVLTKLRTSVLEVTAEGVGGGLAQWEQSSCDMAWTRLHSTVFKSNSSQLFLTDEEQSPYYNKRISWYAWGTIGNHRVL